MNYKGDEKYTPMSSFMTFGNYRVESRERVKLISGVEGLFLPCPGNLSTKNRLTNSYFYPSAQNLDRFLWTGFFYGRISLRKTEQD
jgi:hypothetical protein